MQEHAIASAISCPQTEPRKKVLIMKSPTAFRCAAARALASASMLFVIAFAAAQTNALPTTRTTSGWPGSAVDTEPIEPLRLAAAAGHVDAALAVATRLVDRFEHGGATDDLYEATIWIDRHRSAETFARLIRRIQLKDCDQKILRFHWLCEIGE